MRANPEWRPTRMGGMDAQTRRKTLLRSMAIACTALVLAITSLSAFIRLSRSGLGCEPWPQCQVQVLRQPAEAGAAVAAARIAHRFSAVAALLLIVAMLATAYASSPALTGPGRLVLALLALALFLAVLGRLTADSRLPAVVLGNLLAGFGMLAASWRLVVATAAPRPALPASWTWATLALLVGQVVLGGLVSAAYAGASCPQLAGCDLGAASWAVLDPWRAPDPAVPAGAGAGLHLLHRGWGLAATGAAVVLGVAAWQRGRRSGAVVVLLALAELAAGFLLVAWRQPLALALVHNVLAALLLAAVAGLMGTRGAAR